jgi:hypothetical protein
MNLCQLDFNKAFDDVCKKSKIDYLNLNENKNK